MSLAINPQTVTAVLLTDGWHDVKPKSFKLDEYTFAEGTTVVSGVCPVAYTFDETGPPKSVRTVSGPLTAVLAVRQG